VTPIQAAAREIAAELAALEREEAGGARVLESVTVEVVFDRETRMPRIVTCLPKRQRRIEGGAIPSRRRAG
jgi:hypothetical protein